MACPSQPLSFIQPLCCPLSVTGLPSPRHWHAPSQPLPPPLPAAGLPPSQRLACPLSVTDLPPPSHRPAPSSSHPPGSNAGAAEVGAVSTWGCTVRLTCTAHVAQGSIPGRICSRTGGAANCLHAGNATQGQQVGLRERRQGQRQGGGPG